MTIKILHLSDLHLKQDSVSQDLVLSSMIKTLEKIAKSNSFKCLIITGDIAFSGKEIEYDKAKDFINNIIKVCNIDIRNIFFVPGNHDVDRSKIKSGQLEWWYGFSGEQALQTILDSDESFPKIQSPKEAYYIFAQEFMNRNISVGKFGQYVHELTVEESEFTKIKIVGLNSALFCGYDGDDKEKLALGLEQVNYCDDKVNSEREIVVTCVHHPFKCFHNCEKPTINVVKRFSDIILCGHLHEEDNTIISGGNNGDTVIISAGAAYENRMTQNSFDIIEIDLKDLQTKVVFYKYVSKEHLWTQNKEINRDNDGVFNFKMTKVKLDYKDDCSMRSCDSVERGRYILVLNTKFEELDREKMDELLNKIKAISKDMNVSFSKIVEGSVKIYFETSKKLNDDAKKEFTDNFGDGVARLSDDNEEFASIKVGEIDTSVYHWRTFLKKDYFDLLENAGANFSHNRVEELRLEDLFVSPNLKRISIEKNSLNKIDKIINADEALKKLTGKPLRAIIFGPDYSGKTTLLRWLYEKYYKRGFLPIFIAGAKLKEIQEDKLRKIIQEEFNCQYEGLYTNDISKFDPDRLIILIDDFHRIKFSKPKFRFTLISNLFKVSDNILISGNDILQLDAYTSEKVLEKFERYVVLEYGPKLRYEIIKKWNGLGRGDSDPNDLIRLNNDTESYVESIIGKNFVPSYPIYLITILQAKDATSSQKPEYSLHGFYYELLINDALNRSVKNKDEISLFYNYITDYSYFLFDTKIRLDGVSMEDLTKFHNNYCQDYKISVNLNVVLNTLLNSRLLKLSPDAKFVFVSYKYIYYYFTAKYLANNISNAEIRAKVSLLCERVYRDEYSSIVMFLTHLSKDQFIIDELLKNSRNLFSGLEPAKLEDDVVFINDMVNKLPKRIYNPIDIQTIKNTELEEIDQIDRQNKEHNFCIETIDYDLYEDIQAMDVISLMTKSMKTLEIIGQVTKKYWGSLKAQQKFELADETYKLGLRTLSFYFSLLSEDTEGLIEYLNIIYKTKNPDKNLRMDEIEKVSRNYLFSLSMIAVVGIIRRITTSIGYEKLAGTFEDIQKVNDYNSVNLIDTSIKLNHNKSFPWKELEALNKKTSSHFLSKVALQNLVINYLYIFHTSIEDKQRICSMLGIEMNKQLLIDAISAVKKES
jgi:metallophosphoesterase superfamily enzyme